MARRLHDALIGSKALDASVHHDRNPSGARFPLRLARYPRACAPPVKFRPVHSAALSVSDSTARTCARGSVVKAARGTARNSSTAVLYAPAVPADKFDSGRKHVSEEPHGRGNISERQACGSTCEEVAPGCPTPEAAESLIACTSPSFRPSLHRDRRRGPSRRFYA